MFDSIIDKEVFLMSNIDIKKMAYKRGYVYLNSRRLGFIIR